VRKVEAAEAALRAEEVHIGAEGSLLRLSILEAIVTYKASGIELKNKIEGKENDIRMAVKQLKDLLDKRTSRPLEHKVERVLEKHHIVICKYFGGSLVGEDCHRLISKHQIIINEIQAVLTEPTNRRADVPVDIDLQISTLLDGLNELLMMLDVICSMMADQEIDQFTDADYDIMDGVSEAFGVKWRDHMKIPAPPKLHLVESHTVDQFRRYRNLSFVCEDPIERDHHERKGLNRLFASLSDWEKIQKAILSRKSRAKHPDVLTAQHTSATKTKRNFSNTTTTRKERVVEGQKLVKVLKRNAAFS